MTTATIQVDILDVPMTASTPQSLPLLDKDLIQPPEDLRLSTVLCFLLQRKREEIWTAIDTKYTQGEEERSPFEEFFAQLQAEDKVRRTIEYVKLFESLPYAERLANRIHWLLQATLDDPEENQIIPESLSSFLAFIEAIEGLKYPDIVLSPSGNIIARWRADTNRNLCIEFLPTQEVRFVVFAPNPDRTLRVSGIAPVAGLWDNLKPFQVEQWVLNDSRP